MQDKLELFDRSKRALEDYPRPVLFVVVSGSHLYGFESVNSDIDLRGMHLNPPEEVLGIFSKSETVERNNLVDAQLVETVTHDIGKYAMLLLKGNGNALEQLYSPLSVVYTPARAELIEITQGLLSRRSASHYLGFAQSEWREVQTRPTAKKILYTFRTLLTGIHLMRTGRVRANIDTLTEAQGYTPPFLDELLDIKRGGVEVAGYFGPLEPLEAAYVDLCGRLIEAREQSHLREEAPEAAKARLNDWVVRTRLAGLTVAC